MTISQANLSILDGSLGQVPSTGDQVQAKVGVSTAGPTNTPTFVTTTKAATDLFGTGPLVEAALAALSVPGNGGVVMCRVPTTTTGTVGAGTAGSGNTGTGTYAFGGTPNDAYDLAMKVVATGTNLAAGTAQFQVSLDGGNTYGPVLAVPSGGTYTIPNTGVTVTFTDGGSGVSYKVGDTLTVSAVAPSYTSSDMVAGVNACAAGTQDFFMVHVVGQASSAANAIALAAALSTALVAQAAAFHYYRGIIELPSDTDANIKTAKGTSVFPRVMLAADFEKLSELDGTQRKRHSAWSIMARAGTVRAAEDLGRVKSGPLFNVQGLYRNEETTPGLDSAGIATLRGYAGLAGYFVTSPNMAEAVGSDYSLLQFGRVIDIAAKIIRAKALLILRDDVELDPVTGHIEEATARDIERELISALAIGLVQKKNASSVTVTVDRTANLLSSPTIDITYRVVPRGYALQLTGTLGFTNPALAAQQAA